MTELTSSELAAVIDYTVTNQRYFSSSVPFTPFAALFNDVFAIREVLLMLDSKGFITYGAISSYVAETVYGKGANIMHFDSEICNTVERLVSALVFYTYAVKTDQDYLKITLAGKAAARVIRAIHDLSDLVYNNFMKKHTLHLEPKYGSCLEAQVNATLLGHAEWTDEEFFNKHVAWLFSAKATASGIFTYLQKMVMKSLLFDKYLRITYCSV